MYLSKKRITYRLFPGLALLLLLAPLLGACGQFGGGGGDDSTTWSDVRIFPDHGGWAVTSRGILHTTNDGLAWQVVTPQELSDVSSFYLRSYFWTSQDAWFVRMGQTQYIQHAQKQQPDLARAYHSSDGGRTWQSADIPGTNSTYTDAMSGPGFILNPIEQLLPWQPQGENRSQITINNITATDPQHARLTVTCVNWHTGGGEESVNFIYLRLWQTSDGGRSWQKVREVTDKNYPPNESTWAYFVNNTHGLMTGPQPTSILRTDDAGASWQEEPLPNLGLTGNDLATSGLMTPTFFDATNGVMTLEGFLTHTFYPYITHDGGQTWQTVPPLKAAQSAAPLTYLDAQHWFTTDQTNFYHTDDGGQTWQTTPLPTDFTNITNLSFVTNQNGWAIGVGQKSDPKSTPPTSLVQTTNGGKTWTKVQYTIQ